MQTDSLTFAMIGLGYVGLPLAVEFGNKRPVIGFDVNQKRVTDLQNGQDHTLEVSSEELKQAALLSYTTNAEDLDAANVYTVTVLTPITSKNART
jgi:UDP-N-acetyl-D-galactosamine dehydrogenase